MTNFRSNLRLAAIGGVALIVGLVACSPAPARENGRQAGLRRGSALPNSP